MINRAAFTLGGDKIAAGSRAVVDIPFGKLYTHTELNIGAHVIHGRQDGPVLLITAALHGDEINGVEICRRLLKLPRLNRIKGTLVVVPIVNTYGFVQQSRYLPDRRDLNRSFPGSEKGSLGSRMAYQFTDKILKCCTHAIDLHTGAIHRANLPQVRTSAKDKTALRMAEVFNAPVIIKAASREGTMRGTANNLGIPILLYEAGEALRFDEQSIKIGVRGIVNVMQDLGMLSGKTKAPENRSVFSKKSSWVRAEHDGIARYYVTLGQTVKTGDILAHIYSPYSDFEVAIQASFDGVVIGRNNLPLVNEGEALFHVAEVSSLDEAEKTLDAISDEVDNAMPAALRDEYGVV
ncbi:succinylglutamate desuccinylase/aspartoacylase family protein [Arsukibacterium sp.]|uniref:succinylglutamate desuccinylase/aspartoacylase family protein n=1 Tax=Arsukibacterium sp. TaxID=1977258 RepID=UPI00299EE85C|nr:succinylglutamate desuccinylase/aspartoacylase family protein [Arsukibacterium sp.]MDX1676251.1 succinylglutamate desuccinylase/aspartoacylase family protein [Arsukibacterium sp.]